MIARLESSALRKSNVLAELLHRLRLDGAALHVAQSFDQALGVARGPQQMFGFAEAGSLAGAAM